MKYIFLVAGIALVLLGTYMSVDAWLLNDVQAGTFSARAIGTFATIGCFWLGWKSLSWYSSLKQGGS